MNYELISDYHKILCPEFPAFLQKYCELDMMHRLRGVSLLCGTDFTPLYHNRFFYSRYDHSVGVALIAWHFTHDKAQAIAGLLHDVSTPAFSHVSDFRAGDALTQSSTEDNNKNMIHADEKLKMLLKEDGLCIEQVDDYHIYPVCDNEIPQLSADRLEYMFPSGMSLHDNWTLEEVKEVYDDIIVSVNDDGKHELAFKTLELAEKYCQKFCETSHLLQINEDKLTMQLLAEIVEYAVKCGIISESDLFEKSEVEIIEIFENAASASGSLQPETAVSDNLQTASAAASKNLSQFSSLFRTFRTMTSIEHTDEPLENYFCVSLEVKQRYIDPLVISAGDAGSGKAFRLSEVSDKAKKVIEDFRAWKDTKYGCVKSYMDM